VSVVGNDELSNLAYEINGMMEKLEQAEKFREEVSEARYRAVVQDQTELICRYLPDGTITFVNDACCRYYEMEKDTLLGMNFMSLTRKEHVKFGCSIPAFGAENPGVKWENQVSKPNGEIRWLQWTDRALFDQHGKMIEFQSVGRDITHEVKLESQLRQAQKMEAIGTLAGGIAHDFNNILGGIIGFTELALYQCREPACRRNMERVLTSSDRARNLIQQILTFSRRGEQEKKPVDFGVITKETLNLLRSSIPSTITISENITSASHTVLADATQLHQILMNLCTNAAHAMRERGGVITIDLDNVDIDSRALSSHPGFAMGAYVRLTVSDTGCGIDPSLIDRIFDPFFTTKNAGEGTGLGLSVVYGIVKSHGGVINVYSEPGQGTTFKVYLPRIDTMEPVATKPAEPLYGGKERLLFVDDEEVLIEIGKEMLRTLGYDVVGRTSSIEALQAFRAHPARYDLVITDMTMPNMTGVELAGEILRIRPDIPIILCTGFSELLNDETAARLGIRKILMKPLFIGDLARTIRDILDKGKNTRSVSS
jgi:PAS domain S-box-containing protein